MVRTEASQALSPGSNPGGRILLLVGGFLRELQDDVQDDQDYSDEETYAEEQPSDHEDNAQDQEDPQVVPLAFLKGLTGIRSLDRFGRAYRVATSRAEPRARSKIGLTVRALHRKPMTT